MNPFSSRCCQHNHSQGWPYYSENLIYATPDNGMAAVMYAACTADVLVGNNKKVVVKEETNYPFDENITFTIEKGSAEFPFYLRIPSWTKEAEVAVNGERVSATPVSGKYLVVSRKWQKGDKLTMRLPMTLGMRRWAVNKNSVSVDYGPLTMSLKIKERYVKRDSKETAIGDSKWQKNADASKWPTTEIYADSPWNYALVLHGGFLPLDIEVVRKPWPADNYPFTLDSVPLEIKAKGRRIPSWTMDETGLCGVLPDEDAPKASETESITLVPMGAARLRISAFPTVE